MFVHSINMIYKTHEEKYPYLCISTSDLSFLSSSFLLLQHVFFTLFLSVWRTTFRISLPETNYFNLECFYFPLIIGEQFHWRGNLLYSSSHLVLNEKLSFIWIPLKVMCHFYLAAFKIFSLTLVFKFLILMYFGMDFFMFLLLGVTCWFIVCVFAKFMKFLGIIFFFKYCFNPILSFLSKILMYECYIFVVIPQIFPFVF